MPINNRATAGRKHDRELRKAEKAEQKRRRAEQRKAASVAVMLPTKATTPESNSLTLEATRAPSAAIRRDETERPFRPE